MIELDVIAYLKADATLDILLGSTATDSKIYPLQCPQRASVPYIVYNTPSDGGLMEYINELSMSFDCISDDYTEAKDIKDRIVTLLDREDSIRDLISSADYWFYWCKKTGGTSFKEPELDYFHRVAIFDFLYGRFSMGAIDMINKTLPIKASGSLIDEEIIFGEDGFYFPSYITIERIGLHVRTAPIGSNITIDILKNDIEQSRIATLTDGVKDQTTNIVDIAFGVTDKFGLKVKSIGSTIAGEDLTIIIYYR